MFRLENGIALALAGRSDAATMAFVLIAVLHPGSSLSFACGDAKAEAIAAAPPGLVRAADFAHIAHEIRRDRDEPRPGGAVERKLEDPPRKVPRALGGGRGISFAMPVLTLSFTVIPSNVRNAASL